MADVHVIYALTGEAWGDLLALLLDVEDEGKEPFDIGRGYVVAIRPLDERLALEIEDSNKGSHNKHTQFFS